MGRVLRFAIEKLSHAGYLRKWLVLATAIGVVAGLDCSSSASRPKQN